tara:strand:- start:798 stop:932 length:135 start_codon:yes stop_codon:yes gene_type:complete
VKALVAAQEEEQSVCRKNQRPIASNIVIDWTQVKRPYVELSYNE